MSDSLGYIVVEWNQASKQPSLPDGEVYSSRDEAEDAAAEYGAATAKVRRKDRYSVAEIVELWSA